MTICRHCRAPLAGPVGPSRRYVTRDTRSPFCPGGKHVPDLPRWRKALVLAANRIQRRWFT